MELGSADGRTGQAPAVRKSAYLVKGSEGERPWSSAGSATGM